MAVLSRNLTTLDLIKTFAVIIMVIDHMGFFFFQEDPAGIWGDPNLWWRAVGRLGLPVWFFMIGYSQSRIVDRALVVGACILLLSNLVVGTYFFPLNALFSMLIIRLLIDPLALFAYQRPQNLFLVVFGLTLLSLPTFFIFEYGTLGMLIALLGYGTRHAGKEYGLLRDPRTLSVLFWVVLIVMTLTMLPIFHFDKLQFGVVFFGSAMVLHVLMKYDLKKEFPDLTLKFPRQLVFFLQLCGRRTLEIYVAHLVLFKVIAWVFMLGLPVYGWFEWDWLITESFAKALRIDT